MRELGELAAGAPVLLELGGSEAWAVLGALQLALRHPGLPPTTAAIIERAVDELAAVVATTPALRQMYLAGRGPGDVVPADFPGPGLEH